MTEVGNPPLDIPATQDVHAMTTGTDPDSVTLNSSPITTAIGVVATKTLIKVTPDHSTDLPTATSHVTEAPAPTTAIVIHPTTDPRLTGTLPKMTADPNIGPGNIITNQTEDLHPLHGHHPGNTRTKDTNKSQLMTHHQNITAQMTMTATLMMIYTRCALSYHTLMERATQGQNHYHSSHHRLPNSHHAHRKVLPSINRLRSCHLTNQALHLQTNRRPIQPSSAKLNTADGSPMTTLGSTALHLHIVDFKFTHNFIICNQLPNTELIFGIDIQKKFSFSYTWDKDQQCYIQQNGRFLTFTHITTPKAMIGTVKSTLKIPPRHSGVVPIKISGPLITTDTAHFITDDSTPKGKDPNTNIIDGIHKIKERSTVNVIVSNYTNKHLTFHKGEYIGHLEPLELNSADQGETHQANSITLKKMMSETVTSESFNLPHHKISTPCRTALNCY